MELGLNRRNIGRLVLLAWAVMLAWLARREFTRGEDSARSQQIARLAPAGMIFVPCKDGISHNEIEDANKADIGAGAQRNTPRVAAELRA